MQKLAPILVSIMATWLGTAQAQTPDYIIQQNNLPLRAVAHTQLVAPSPAPEVPGPVSKPAPPAPAVAQVAPPVVAKRIKVALLLPTESKLLGDAATIVRQGFEAAASVDNTADVIAEDAEENNVVQRYRDALSQGANVVVGPLSRGGIAAVAPYVTVPTLALNSVGKEVLGNPRLYILSLNVEAEARQIAELMRDEGRDRPLVIVDNDPLSLRLKQAFVDQWNAKVGTPVSQVVDNGDNLADILTKVSQSDAVFLALSSKEAGMVKIALAPELPVYATSLLNTTTDGDPALAGIHYVDMPWFLMKEQAEVKRYPRPTTPLTTQTERLYALGIDAYRLAILLAKPKQSASALTLEGVTGSIRLGKERVFERRLPVAVMKGKVSP